MGSDLFPDIIRIQLFVICSMLYVLCIVVVFCMCLLVIHTTEPWMGSDLLFDISRIQLTVLFVTQFIVVVGIVFCPYWLIIHI